MGCVSKLMQVDRSECGQKENEFEGVLFSSFKFADVGGRKERVIGNGCRLWKGSRRERGHQGVWKGGRWTPARRRGSLPLQEER